MLLVFILNSWQLKRIDTDCQARSRSIISPFTVQIHVIHFKDFQSISLQTYRFWHPGISRGNSTWEEVQLAVNLQCWLFGGLLNICSLELDIEVNTIPLKIDLTSECWVWSQKMLNKVPVNLMGLSLVLKSNIKLFKPPLNSTLIWEPVVQKNLN